MKAIVISEFGEPSVLKIQEVPKPEPKEDEVLIRVHAFGINPVETYLRAGTYRRLPTLPYTPGRDCGGVVEQVGASVTEFQVGDRVFTDTMRKGAYSQYFAVPEADVLLLGDGVTYGQGASVGVGYRTAYRALFEKANINSGDWVLIRGASGGVGQACIEMACLHGARVIGSSSTEQGRALIMSKGAEAALNHNSESFEDEIKDITGGDGIDCIVEMLANKNLHSDLQILAQNGAVVIVGNRGTIEINPRDLMMKETRILGMLGGPRNPAERKRYQAYLASNIKKGIFSPSVGVSFPLEECPESHVEVLEHNKGTTGKIIVCPFGVENANSTQTEILGTN